LPVNAAIARFLLDIIGALVDVTLGPIARAPAGETDTLPDSRTLVARIQAWRASGASMAGIESQSSPRAPVQNAGSPADAGSEHLEPADALPAPPTQTAATVAASAASVATPASEVSGAAAAGPAPVSVSSPVDAAENSASPAASPAAANDPVPSTPAAVTTPAAQATAIAPETPAAPSTPPDLVPVPGQPGTFVNRSAFAQLGLESQAPGAPISATMLAASPARSGVVDTAAVAALLSAHGVDRSPLPAAAAVNDLPQSPALAGHVDTQHLAGLGLPSNREPDSLLAAWSGLPAVPILMQTGAPAHAPVGEAAAQPQATADGAKGNAPEATDSVWPSLPEWPLPSDEPGAERGSLRERVEASWYV
jgi:hypothetical protein